MELRIDDIQISMAASLARAHCRPVQCRSRWLIQFLFSATLAQTFNNLSSALTGAAIKDLAFAEPFIAAGAAVGFWYFFPTEKGLGPRGYERNEIMNAW